MAACLITVSGTSGVIRINYTISGTPYTIETSIGSFYIEDTATSVTYTTLSGDLTASSGCLTITELPASCYILFWKGIASNNYKTSALILGSETITVSEINFPITGKSFVSMVNDLGDDRIKVIGYKISYSGNNNIPEFNSEQSYILKVLGTDFPILKVRNADDTGYIYIYGELQADCLPQAGYTIVDPCYNSLPPAP